MINEMLQEQPNQVNDSRAFCYYSTFPLFDENYNISVIKKQRFIRKLLMFLGMTYILYIQKQGEEWKTYAGCSTFYDIDSKRHYLNWQYCFDYLLVHWFEVQQHTEDQMPDFIMEVRLKFEASQVKYDDIYLRPVCEGFYLSGIQVWEKVRISRPPSIENIPELENVEDSQPYRFLKPLAVVTGKIIQYIRQGHTQSQTSQIQQNSCFRVLSQIGDSMLSQDIVQQAYQQMESIYTKSHQGYQVAQHFVMTIIEVNQCLIKNISDRSDKVNLRFLQPATGFYNELLQLWVILRNPDKNFEFHDFLQRVIVFLGNKWSDKYLYPTQFFYQRLFEVWANIMQDPNMAYKNEDQVYKKLKPLLNYQGFPFYKYGIMKQYRRCLTTKFKIIRHSE